MKNPWKTVKKNILYENKFGHSLREDDVITPKGMPGKYTVFEGKGSVVIIPLDKDRRLYMVRQWRYPIEEDSLEIPAGTMENNDTPLSTAKRELSEELGAICEEMIPLCSHWVGNGVMKIKEYMFLAKNIELSGPKHLDDTEEIQTEVIPLSKAVGMVLKGTFQDERTQLGILLADKYLQKK